MAKCSECGFLAVRNRDTQELVETDQNIRESGVIQVVTEIKGAVGLTIAGSHPMYELPLCLIRTYDLRPEYGESPISTKIKSAIDKDRECISFTQWIQGLTPKEHREMMDRKTILEWQTKREDLDRKWQTMQLWLMVIVAGIFTILGGVIGAVVALFSSGIK